MLNVILNMLGTFLESIILTLFLSSYNNLKNKQKAFFIILLFVGQIILSIIMSSFLFYLLYWAYIFMLISILIKKINIINIFMIGKIFLYMLVINCIFYFGITNYYVTFIGYFMFLFGTHKFIIKIIRKIYNFYINNWNIKKDNKIKSITVRNIGLVLLNTSIYLIYLFVLYLLIYRG